MPYKFTFDLSKLPRFFFNEITIISYQKGMHKTFLNTLKEVITKFKIQEATGLNLSDAIILLQDLIDLQGINLMQRKKFLKTKKRALFLPHCTRKFMDNRCQATFDPNIPSYNCKHCSKDCLVSKANRLAEDKGYDVYVVPGGSCVPKIIKNSRYEGAIGIACGEEIKMSGDVLGSLDVAGQAIPLIKNGCANTAFSLDTLQKIL
ncbi:MAG TPA: DUF116 domain-containing protein [Candidatus Glassbacteria bacterium]|nr:DUF116 domain-containing protein [Candidatus Glassbacteria bacterium]